MTRAVACRGPQWRAEPKRPTTRAGPLPVPQPRRRCGPACHSDGTRRHRGRSRSPDRLPGRRSPHPAAARGAPPETPPRTGQPSERVPTRPRSHTTPHRPVPQVRGQAGGQARCAFRGCPAEPGAEDGGRTSRPRSQPCSHRSPAHSLVPKLHRWPGESIRTRSKHGRLTPGPAPPPCVTTAADSRAVMSQSPARSSGAAPGQ